MNFNKHYDIEGQHAFLSASKYHWVNYDKDKLIATYTKHMATQRGTELHEFAMMCIRLKRKQRNTRDPLNQYINDAIGFRMKPEQPLFYSVNAFGTADSISFRDGLLRIHDLKTGVSPVSMKQLEVYAALFCLEYHEDPTQIGMELRIYQTEEKEIYVPKGKDILQIMETIVEFDKEIERLKLESED